jgi:hypothetical protein
MNVLETLENPEFPLKWAILEGLRKNTCPRKEIYLRGNDDEMNDLMYLFYKLFGECKDELLVYNKWWWEFCLSVWNIEKHEYNFDISTKSENCGAYLKLLNESGVPRDYFGCCKCNSWDAFLPIILKCVLSHEAPYSPIFVNATDEFFFYFHHTGSIGIYYKTAENTTVRRILETASELYDVVD